MSDCDSGVETGSEGNESVMMSVESPARLDEDQGEAQAVFIEMKELPPQACHLAASSEQIFSIRIPANYMTQHDYVNKIRPTLSQKYNNRWKSMRMRGIYPKVVDYIGEKKLRKAALSNDYESAMKLLENGIDPCSADSKKRTALHFVVCRGNAQFAQLLLDKGADPNQKDILGNTPLHLAACTSNIELITILLRAGTDINSMDHLGRSPFHIALAKLRMIQLQNLTSSDQVKSQVCQVVEMMQVYLQRQGKSEEVHLLNEFNDRLQSHHTKQEVDSDLAGLMNSLSHLSLCR